MKFRPRLILPTLVLLRLSVFGLAGDLLLDNVVLVLPGSGQITPGQSLLVVGDSIRAVGPTGSLDLSPGVERVDLAGRFVMPGLWDMHFHPGSSADLEMMIANGVLGARIMWGTPEHLKWRAAIELGEMRGPRLFVAGPIIEGQPPPELASVISTTGRRLLETREEGEREARAQKAAGFDYLKVYNNLSLAAYGGLVAEGRRIGIPIVGHIPFEVGLMAALEARQATVEHLRGYIQHLVKAEAPTQPGADLRSRTLAWEYADPGRIADLVRSTAEAETWHCPTLSVRIFFDPQPQVERYLASPAGEFISSESKAMLQDRSQIEWLSNFSEEDFERAARGFKTQDLLIESLYKAGVPILAGTDMTPAGFTLHDELERLVGAGLDEKAALQTATENPARFVGLEQRAGKIAAGFDADLVILDRNPLENIRATRTIFAVVFRGQLLRRADLDTMLEGAKQKR